MALRSLVAKHWLCRAPSLAADVAAPTMSAAYTLLRSCATSAPAQSLSTNDASTVSTIDVEPVRVTRLMPQGWGMDITVPVYNLDRQQVGTHTLPGDVFDLPIRRDILQRVVRWQLAKRQQGTHVTKGRSDVRGGGRKPRPQKGSGQSRQGTIRAPQWRGGGVVHGPVVRSHEIGLFRKVRRLGLMTALSAKAAEGRLLVLDSLAPAEPKTKAMDGHLNSLLANAPRRSVLMVDSGKLAADGGEPARLAAANLVWVDVLPQEGLNVYSILQRDHLILTRSAVEMLVDRLRRPILR